MASKAFYAIVAGVGPGTGRAVALRFAQAYPVVLLARQPDSYDGLVAEIAQAGGKAIGISADMSDDVAVKSAFAAIGDRLPGHRLAAAVYNVGSRPAVKPFLETSRAELDASVGGNAGGFYNFAKSSLPLLLESVDEAPHPPTLLVTGATASLRGSARYSLFAAGKFAKRALAQSLAREFGPKGIHVAHVIIDGVIESPKTLPYKPQINNGAVDGMLDPNAIAETYWHLHTQHRSAFSFEMDMRPFIEKF